MNPDTKSYLEKKERLIYDFKSTCEKDTKTISLNKNSSNLFRPRASEKNNNRIDLGNFNRVLQVDKENLLACVEAMTTYEDLVNETLKHNCLPTVVPELKTITIGGALAGCGIEASSFRFGLVHETIENAEILLSDGKVITCNPNNEHRDLFFAFPNSYGTLGYALKVSVKLIPVKKFVKLVHHHFSDSTLYFETLQRLCSENKTKDEVNFIDGVVFSRHEMYITTGEFVDEAPFVSDYTYRNIYYRSISRMKEDYLTTYDFIWRWDTDWFWCSKVFLMQNPIIRLIFGKFMLTSKVYTKVMNYINRHPRLSSFLSSMQARKESVIQDVLIPIHNAKAFLDFFQKEIGISPIWICPSQSFSKQAYDFCPIDPKTLYVDFGFWDAVTSDKEDGFYNKKIEEMVKKLNGFKSLYSSSYYTEDEFWKLYDQKKYQDLKSKYDPEMLLSNLYKKMH